MFALRILLVMVAAMAFSTPAVVMAQAQAPAAATSTNAPTSAMVKTALKAANPSLSQFRKIAPMVESYKSQTANADPATKQAASKSLMKNIMGVLSPAQQQTFKQSLMTQMMAAG